MAGTGDSHRLGVQKELRRGSRPPPGMPPDQGVRPFIPEDTLMTPGNYGKLVVTKQALSLIANRISRITGAAMSAGQVTSLISHINALPETPFYNLTFVQACDKIAQDYINRGRIAARTKHESGDIARLADLDDGGLAGMAEYQRRELEQLTPNENPYSTQAFANRRGNAVVDEQRVDGIRSSPDSIAPAASLPYGPNGPAGPVSNVLGSGYIQNVQNGQNGNRDDSLKVLIPAMKLIGQTLEPKNLDSLLNRNRNLYNTYDNVSMVRQTVQFDSRNRLLTSNSNRLEWDIHTAGQPGQLGAIRMEDTLQDFIAVTLHPFWLPIVDLEDDYYETIHMDIKELSHQHVPVTEYLDPTENIPETSHYVFELRIKQRVLNRLYLEPKEETFKLRNPRKRLEKLTVDFRTPFQLLTIQSDRVTFTMTFGNPTVMTSVTPHNIVTGDLIYIYNSNTGNAALDARITQRSGWFATRVDDFTIQIALDTSAIAGSQTNIRTYIGSKRVSFELEFVSLDA